MDNTAVKAPAKKNLLIPIIAGAAALVIIIALVLVFTVFNKVAVSFIDADGTVLGTEKIKKGECPAVPKSNPEPAEGFIFNCWTGKDGEPFDFNEPVKSKTDIFAGYLKVYTVGFYADGKLVDEQKVIENEKAVDNVDAPEKEDMAFVAWMNGSSEYKFDAPVTADLHLNAAYKKFIPASGMNVSCDNTKLTVGDKERIVCKLVPDDTTEIPAFESSNESVLKVDGSGNVTALNEGTAIVKVSTAGLWDTVSFNVFPAPGSITLNKSEAEVKVKESVTLTAEVKPDKALNKEVKWSSADEKIATVDDKGKVTGVKEGSVVITAETYNGLKAECKVSVKLPDATGVTLDNDSIVLDLVNSSSDSKKLTAKVSPENASQKVTWSVNDSSIIKVDENGNVKALKPGKATVTAKTANGKTATCSVKVIRSAEKIYFDVDSAAVNLNGTYDAGNRIFFSPGNDTGYVITWNSSNTSVATVNEYGMVTGTGVSKSQQDYTTISATCKNDVSSVTVSMIVYCNGGELKAVNVPSYAVSGTTMNYSGTCKFISYSYGKASGEGDVTGECYPYGTGMSKTTGNNVYVGDVYSVTEKQLYFSYSTGGATYKSNTVTVTVEPKMTLEVISASCSHPSGPVTISGNPVILCPTTYSGVNIEVKCNVPGCSIECVRSEKGSAFGNNTDVYYRIEADGCTPQNPGIIHYTSPAGQYMAISVYKAG